MVFPGDSCNEDASKLDAIVLEIGRPFTHVSTLRPSHLPGKRPVSSATRFTAVGSGELAVPRNSSSNTLMAMTSLLSWKYGSLLRSS